MIKKEQTIYREGTSQSPCSHLLDCKESYFEDMQEEYCRGNQSKCPAGKVIDAILHEEILGDLN